MKDFKLQAFDEYIRLQEVTNDHQIRAVISFASFVDMDRLQRAILLSFKMVPILACKYVPKGRKALWEALPQIDLDSCFSVHEEQPLKQTMLSYLKKIPHPYDGPQVKFHLIRENTHDTLIVVLNHMVFDGQGFKEYLYLLAELYSHPEQYKHRDIHIVDQERSLSRLLKNLTFFQKLKSMSRKAIITKSSLEILSHQSNDKRARFIHYKVDSDTFLSIKQICHEWQITLNDFTIALFAESLFNIRDVKVGTPITIQTMFDMRRYVGRYPVSLFGNFSSMESVLITKENESFMDRAAQVGRAMLKIKENLPGVQNLLMINTLYKLLPRRGFGRLLSNAIQSFNVSTSNLGIIDEKQLVFERIEVDDAYLLTSIKNEPSMQLTCSTYRNELTLSLLGNYSDGNWEIIEALFFNIKSIIKDIGEECINEHNI